MESENNENVSDTGLTYGSHLPGDDTNCKNITRPDVLDHPSQVGLHDASQDAEHVEDLVSADGTATRQPTEWTQCSLWDSK